MEEYYISIYGQEKGPFTFDQLLEEKTNGQFEKNTFFWKEGMPEWRPIEEIVAAPGHLSTRSSLVRAEGVIDADFADEGVYEPFSGENLNRQVLEAAKAQKGVIWCIIAYLLCVFFPPAYLLVVPVGSYYVYKLAKSLHCGPPILWAIGMLLLPIINLVLLVILSQKATAVIRRSGFKVGFLGAKLN